MLTQEYEGRGVDVTIMPWVGWELPRTANLSNLCTPFFIGGPHQRNECSHVGDKGL